MSVADEAGVMHTSFPLRPQSIQAERGRWAVQEMKELIVT